MEEKKNPDMNGKELTEENLEQVTGGITLPLGIATDSDDGAATAENVSPAGPFVIDHQQPYHAIGSNSSPAPSTIVTEPQTLTAPVRRPPKTSRS